MSAPIYETPTPIGVFLFAFQTLQEHKGKLLSLTGIGEAEPSVSVIASKVRKWHEMCRCWHALCRLLAGQPIPPTALDWRLIRYLVVRYDGVLVVLWPFQFRRRLMLKRQLTVFHLLF